MKHTCNFMHVLVTQELRQSRLYNGQNFAFYWFSVYLFIGGDGFWGQKNDAAMVDQFVQYAVFS